MPATAALRGASSAITRRRSRTRLCWIYLGLKIRPRDTPLERFEPFCSLTPSATSASLGRRFGLTQDRSGLISKLSRLFSKSEFIIPVKGGHMSRSYIDADGHRMEDAEDIPKFVQTPFNDRGPRYWTQSLEDC